MKVSVIGIGYVGLPLAIKLAELGFEVTSIDKNKSKVISLRKGLLPFAENEPLLSKRFEKTFREINFSESFSNIKQAETIFVCVDTPIKRTTPDNDSLKSATKNLSKFLKKGATVIVESTIAPGTTQNLVIPTIEKYSKLKLNRDFFVAVVPERIRPSHIFEQLTNLPRVIGLSSKKIKAKLFKIYSKITSGSLDFVDIITSEVVKTVENTYRDVNIAFANEIALACEELGVNVWEVRKLVNKSPFHDMHKPGAGVGGHCLPKDPRLLISSIRKQKLKLTTTARDVNDSMPNHVFELITKALGEKRIAPQNAQIAVLGYAYVKNTDDIRNSPSQALVSILEQNDISYSIHDPQVEKYSKKNPYDVARNTDCLVLMVDHDDYLTLNLAKLAKITRHQILIDGRNFFRRKNAQRLGFLYRGIGNV